MPFDYIAKSLRVAGQLPLDDKTYFKTLALMKDLGLTSSKAYEYYEWMKILCAENGQYYIWQEVAENYEGGILDENFQYGPNTLSNGVDYSSRYFNFVPESEGLVVPAIAKPFIIFKDWPTNQEDYLQINDLVSGHFSSTVFLNLARYKGGAVNVLTNFATKSSFNPKELI